MDPVTIESQLDGRYSLLDLVFERNGPIVCGRCLSADRILPKYRYMTRRFW